MKSLNDERDAMRIIAKRQGWDPDEITGPLTSGGVYDNFSTKGLKDQSPSSANGGITMQNLNPESGIPTVAKPSDPYAGKGRQ